MSVTVSNPTSNLSGKEVVLTAGTHTVTGAWTFDRDPSAPFSVTAGSAKVTNLDADKLDGLDGPASAIVGLTDSQTLTNKTLTAPIVNRTVVTLTTTGTVNDWAPGLAGDTIIRCNNATLLTIQGIAGGYDGQRILLESVGAGIVALAHQNGSSAAANRLINFAASGSTMLAAGVGTAELVYDATTARWRLFMHEQGDYIDYSATSSIVGWSAFTTKSFLYKLQGRSLTILWYFQGTSNNTSVTFTLPYTTITGAGGIGGFASTYSIDNGGTQVPAETFTVSASTTVNTYPTFAGGSWTASGTKYSIGQMVVNIT